MYYANESVLTKLNHRDFLPFALAKTGMQQTILAYYLPFRSHIKNTVREKIPLTDGDSVVISIDYPAQPLFEPRMILMVHGLSGSEQSKYMIRMTRLFTQQGFWVVRMNLRGAGAGKYHAKKLYNGGMTQDVSAVLAWLKQSFPQMPVTGIGFSLGANLILKLAGERIAHGNLDSVVAVSPPLDLYACVKLLGKPPNQFLDKHFAQALTREVYDLHQHLNIPIPDFPNKLSVYEFDERYTAPQNQYASAKAYYQEASALGYLDQIDYPTFILYAKNDPIIFTRRFRQIPQKSNFDVLITENGGHMGWVSRYPSQPFRWMDSVIAAWVNWFNYVL